MVGVFSAEIIPDDLPRAVFIGRAEFPSKFGTFKCSHDSECGPRPDQVRDEVGLALLHDLVQTPSEYDTKSGTQTSSTVCDGFPATR